MMMMVAKCNTLSACGTGLLLLFLVLATIASGAEQQLRGSNSINGNGNGNGNGNVNDPRELRQAIGSSSSGGGSSSSMINANVNSETTVTGTTTTTCGGIRETICSLPDTIFLCRALERTGLDLNLDLDRATTFFAPVDGAMDYLSLSPLVARDLTKPGVLAHVLLEHVLVSSSATNSGNDSGNDNGNGNGVLESWDDLECGGELVMANGEIVDVVCTENEKEKHLVGVGNRVLRTLPKAVATTNTEDTNVRIETCDGTSVIYLVDQVILPAIPLSDGATTTTTTTTGGEDSNNDNNDNDALQAPEQRLCPLSQPTVGSRCPSTTAVVEDLVCAYSYSYQGCSWEYLECAPTKTCTCSEEAADTTTSTATTTTPTFAWSCLSFAARPCFFVNEEEATPVGACDPDLPMPKPPQQQQQVSDNNNGTDVGVDPDEGLDVEDSMTDNNSICQATTNPDPNGACDTTDIGTICEYGHVYTGCSWDELQCTWTTRCECYERFSISDSNSVSNSNSNGFGAWGCVAVKILPCFFFDDEDRDLLPPQGYCDPDLPLPEPPLGSNDNDNDNDNTNTTDVVVVVVGDEEDDTDTDSDNCPASRPRPNDACNTAISSCEYGYIYTGCSWDQLKCEWTTRCECQGNGNGDTDSGTGTWACLAKGIMPCFSGIGNGRDIVPSFESVFGYESASKEDNDRRSAAIPYPTDLDNTNTNTNTNIPDGLPRGERCDPSQPLPEPEETETTTTTVVTVEGRLIEECPSSHPYPQSSCTDDSYVSGLQCEYNHIYAGCSWEEISCVPIVTCTCDQFGSGKWDCMSMAMMRCDSSSTPKGLPFGQYCNPKAPLPTMATTAAAATAATATMAEQEQRGSVVLAEDASNGGMP